MRGVKRWRIVRDGRTRQDKCGGCEYMNSRHAMARLSRSLGVLLGTCMGSLMCRRH